ncbi:MAG: hypothetical protein IH987_08775, partial [Planctomycetes bacterium]|nr:hypothetical protein [Planctomycetota bacterium]
MASEKLAEIQDGDQLAKVVLIGALDAEDFPQLIANFVRAVKRFKSEAVSTNLIWWVNQGKTFSIEQVGEYIWAPQSTKSGATSGHHKNVSKVHASDVIVHYANGSIVALGQAQTAGASFSQALDVLDGPDPGKAKDILTSLADKGPHGYRVLARFQLAA